MTSLYTTDPNDPFGYASVRLAIASQLGYSDTRAAVHPDLTDEAIYKSRVQGECAGRGVRLSDLLPLDARCGECNEMSHLLPEDVWPALDALDATHYISEGGDLCIRPGVVCSDANAAWEIVEILGQANRDRCIASATRASLNLEAGEKLDTQGPTG